MDSSVNQEDGSFISFDYNLLIQSGKKKQKTETMRRLPCFRKIFNFFFKLLEIIQTNKIEPSQFSTKAKFYVYSI